MSVHVGEVSTQVEVQGVAGQAPPAPAPARPPTWDERQRHRELTEDDARSRARTAGGGFDG
jgi:hypothetical protein